MGVVKSKAMGQAELLTQMTLCLEKLGVVYAEHFLKGASPGVKSGFCLIEGELHFIMDKKKRGREKLRILALALARLDMDSIHVPPGVRQAIEALW